MSKVLADVRGPSLPLQLGRGITEVLWFYAVFVSAISCKTQFDWMQWKTLIIHTLIYILKKKHINQYKNEKTSSSHHLSWQQQVSNYFWLQSHSHFSKTFKNWYLKSCIREDQNTNKLHRKSDRLAPHSALQSRDTSWVRCVPLAASKHIQGHLYRALHTFLGWVNLSPPI